MGSIRGYLEVPHDKNWIQWGSKQKWYELYRVRESTTELALFFGRHLREKDTGWEKTPKVRWSALQFGDREAIDDIILEDFPVPTTEYKEFFLGYIKLLSPSHSLTTQRISYDS